MRTPSSARALFNWHTQSIKGLCPQVHENEPECGWYKTRFVKGGPWVPARIFIEREICPETGELLADEILCCEINGEKKNPLSHWVYMAKNPITKNEFLALLNAQKTIPYFLATHKNIDLSERAVRP